MEKQLISKSLGKALQAIDKFRCGILLLIFVTASSLSTFAVDYVVTANSLNVRSQPNTHSKVIGKLSKGDRIVNAAAGQGDWISFMLDGKVQGYVSVQYLREIGGTAHNQQVARQSQEKIRYAAAINEAKSRLRWFLCIGFGALLLIPILGERLNIPIWLDAVGFLLLPLLLLYYFSATPYSLWFVYPSVVGWGWTTGNFILFLIIGSVIAMFFVDCVKQITDWSAPLYTLFMLILACLLGYDIYLCISAIFHQVPGALLILFGMLPGGCKGASGEGILRDKYGHDVEGHMGSNGDFHGRDGNTYKKNWGDDTWSRE